MKNNKVHQNVGKLAVYFNQRYKILLKRMHITSINHLPMIKYLCCKEKTSKQKNLETFAYLHIDNHKKDFTTFLPIFSTL